MAKIIKEYPPNYDKIKQAFNPPETACYCYGDTIYNPSGNDISEDILIHEGVHTVQQGKDIEEWWNKYIADDQFRKSQEVEAYAIQYNFIKKSRKSKMSDRYLEMFSDHLSSMYGLNIDIHKAKTLIRIKSKECLL